MENELLKKFRITDKFFGRYERLIKDSVIPYQERALNDRIDGAEKSHCIENFRMAAKKLATGSCDGEFYGMVFQDSDVAKWLEGAAYSLAMFPDKALEARCDEVIELLGKAQQSDGYLNTYFTVKEPEKRWTNLQEAHELYCAGHLIEAAVAYAEMTGKTRFLDIMRAMADHIYKHFIADGAEGWSGHPEIELALVRLYKYTGEKRYLELAQHFIDVRGTSDYFIEESKKRGWTVWGSNAYEKEYTQSDAPVREQSQATGHAVRAVYLYTGMALTAAETGDKALADACERLWENITEKQMYVTGAIGSAYEGEAFTTNYHLPNDTAYGETCASIGLIFFSRRMLDIEKRGKYADVMERALYNGVLAGMELDGTKFFYVNPLEVIPGISGKAKTHFHTLPQRPKWFACACCPPNVARLLPSVAEYAWCVEGNTVYSNLFIGGELDLSDTHGGVIAVETGYPYAGEVNYTFKPNNGMMRLTLALRLPAWSKETVIAVNGKAAAYTEKDGYAYLDGEFSDKDRVTLSLDMTPRRVFASTQVSDDSGKAAVTRGPLVYCAEGADNGDVLSLRLKRGGSITVKPYSDELCGIVPLEAEGVRVCTDGGLYTYDRPSETPCTIRLIPYYSWCNRGLNQMRVWLPEE